MIYIWNSDRFGLWLIGIVMRKKLLFFYMGATFGGGVPFNGKHDVIPTGSNDLSITTIIKLAALKTSSASVLHAQTFCYRSVSQINATTVPVLLPDHSSNVLDSQQNVFGVKRQQVG